MPTAQGFLQRPVSKAPRRKLCTLSGVSLPRCFRYGPSRSGKLTAKHVSQDWIARSRHLEDVIILAPIHWSRTCLTSATPPPPGCWRRGPACWRLPDRWSAGHSGLQLGVRPCRQILATHENHRLDSFCNRSDVYAFPLGSRGSCFGSRHDCRDFTRRRFRHLLLRHP